jgi:predicted nucleic acid-binding protein
MIAIDANAVVAMLVDDADLGRLSRRVYTDHDLAAPDLLPYEVTSVLRKLWRTKVLSARAAERGLAKLGLLRLSAVPHSDISRRIWELRDNLSAYDAAYVAVAEFFDVPLLTFDKRVRNAPGASCRFVEM